MKFVKVLPLLFTLISSNNLLNAAQETSITPTFTKPTAKTLPAPKTIPQAKIAPTPKIIPKAVTPAAPATVPSSSIPSSSVIPGSERESSQLKVPYLKELQNAKMSPAILSGWQQLYEQFLQANAAHPNIPAGATAKPDVALAKSGDPENLKNFLSTNFFNLMATYLNPDTVPKIANDPDAQNHFNYATIHLRDTVTRLGSISSITNVSGTPAVNSVGDCRDMGIIVNIQNNTDAQFTINQTSLDGTKTMQIGQLNPGLNEVNLHTAALQTPATATAKGAAPTPATTINCFEIMQKGTGNDWTISIKLMTGTELLASLKPINANKPDIFLMNGEPTASRYIAKPNNFYLVLTNLPTSINSNSQDNQRIQVLDITEFSGPFLATLQINPVNTTTLQTNPTQPTTINQPSMVSVQIINPLQTPNEKTNPKFNLPLLIIPQFLWETPTKTPSIVQAYWMLIHTIYLQTLSPNLMNQNNFGNALEYFQALECFDETKACRIVIDLFSILQSGQKLFDAPWIMGSNVFETSMKLNKDIDKIYSSQNSEDKIIANSQDANIINCFFKIQNQYNNAFKTNTNFSNLYKIPHSDKFLFTIPNSKNLNALTVFATLKKTNQNFLMFKITNKENQNLFTHLFYTQDLMTTCEFDFITNNQKWSGSKIDFKTTSTTSSKKIQKIKIEYLSVNKKFSLKILPFMTNDKKIYKHIIKFSKQPPLENLFIDAYEQRNLSSYSTFSLIKDQILPSFLQNLTTTDWETGISFIPAIKQDSKIKNQKNLVIKFYKQKTYLGKLMFNNIKTPIKAYNLRSKNFDPAFDIYLTTEIILKYQPNQ